MTAQPSSELYRRGLELAEAGRHQEGLNCLFEYLRGAPQDAEALNDAGAILHCLGRKDEAIAYLTRANELQPGRGEIQWNLVEAYLADGKAAEAATLFDELERMHILNVDVLNRAATMLLDQNRKGLAVEVLLRSYRMWPEQDVLRPILDIIRSRRPRVAFFRSGAGEDGALADVCDFVQQRFHTTFDGVLEPGTLTARLPHSDIAWFDGGGAMVVEASRLDEPCKIIVSLRRADVQGDWVKKVAWEKVDIVVQIGSAAVEEALLEKVPDIRNRTRLTVVPNGVNLDRYTLQRRQRGKNLVCMGRLTLEANPAFLLQCMQKLHYIDPEYRLFFAGTFEDAVLEQYTRHMVQTLGLTGVVSFEPYPSDLNAWLSDKHFVVTSGIGETQVEGVLGAMACGLKPVVHNFPGAEKLLPPSYLFNIAEQFCEQVLSGEYAPETYRQFIEQRFSAASQLEQVNGILLQLESEIDAQLLATYGREGQSAEAGMEHARDFAVSGSESDTHF